MSQDRILSLPDDVFRYNIFRHISDIDVFRFAMASKSSFYICSFKLIKKEIIISSNSEQDLFTKFLFDPTNVVIDISLLQYFRKVYLYRNVFRYRTLFSYLTSDEITMIIFGISKPVALGERPYRPCKFWPHCPCSNFKPYPLWKRPGRGRYYPPLPRLKPRIIEDDDRFNFNEAVPKIMKQYQIGQGRVFLRDLLMMRMSSLFRSISFVHQDLGTRLCIVQNEEEKDQQEKERFDYVKSVVIRNCSFNSKRIGLFVSVIKDLFEMRNKVRVKIDLNANFSRKNFSVLFSLDGSHGSEYLTEQRIYGEVSNNVCNFVFETL